MKFLSFFKKFRASKSADSGIMPVISELAEKIEFPLFKRLKRKKNVPEKIFEPIHISGSEKEYLNNLQMHFVSQEFSEGKLPSNHQQHVPKFTLNICSEIKPLPAGMVKMFDFYTNSGNPF